jgi:hypothetical protein
MDGLFLVGNPRGFQRWSIYVILNVDELDTVVSMIDDFRHQPFWPIEQHQGP